MSKPEIEKADEGTQIKITVDLIPSNSNNVYAPDKRNT